MSLPIINTISFTLFAIVFPVFIFVVTLLGSAINKAQEEESKTKEQQKKDFELKINDMGNKIKTAQTTGDTSDLEKQLKDLVDNRRKFDKQLKKIKNKYSLIKFKEAVILPGAFCVLSVLVNELTQNFNTCSTIVIICWVLAVALLVIAIARIFKCLSLVQEISISSQEYQTQKMAEAFVSALELHEKKHNEELDITFQNITFPHQAQPAEELSIDFRVKLIKGKVAENVAVWFHIPDEFEIVSPSHSWRQAPDFVVPNIRTVKVLLGKISQGPYTPRTLKIKCPQTIGKYFIMYRIYADGYSNERKDAEILVGQITEDLK
ncbi:MAG: hypothetical protein KAX15_01525 [Candidatus Omnitrophica bacterium]|nr:hypothetical protein [Candidatus Omnitrophota bacterium]